VRSRCVCGEKEKGKEGQKVRSCQCVPHIFPHQPLFFPVPSSLFPLLNSPSHSIIFIAFLHKRMVWIGQEVSADGREFCIGCGLGVGGGGMIGFKGFRGREVAWRGVGLGVVWYGGEYDEVLERFVEGIARGVTRGWL